METPAKSFSLPLPGKAAATHRQFSQCVVSFGSNLGDRRELLAKAARSIADSGIMSEGGSLQTSRLFETPPIGGPGGQSPFLNAVGAFQTTAPATEVLGLLQRLELSLGRQRRLRWDARSVDLDVVLHGNLVGGASGLVVPHPRYTARQFVLRPACDVAGHFRDPRFGWTLQQISEHLGAAVPSLALVTGRQELRDLLCQRLEDEFGVKFVGCPKECAEWMSRDGGPTSPWCCSFLPNLPKPAESPSFRPGQENSAACAPRLLVRIQESARQTAWPAPHLMWPSGWNWPEYRLEIGEMDWSVSELASAIESMHCQAEPVTEDGHWW